MLLTFSKLQHFYREKHILLAPELLENVTNRGTIRY